MSTKTLVLEVAVGAGFLAIWVEARFGSRGPRTITGTFIHTALAILALKFSSKGILLVVAGSESPARKMVAVFIALLPALVYAWLSSIWLLKLLQRSAQLR